MSQECRSGSAFRGDLDNCLCRATNKHQPGQTSLSTFLSHGFRVERRVGTRPLPPPLRSNMQTLKPKCNPFYCPLRLDSRLLLFLTDTASTRSVPPCFTLPDARGGSMGMFMPLSPSRERGRVLCLNQLTLASLPVNFFVLWRRRGDTNLDTPCSQKMETASPSPPFSPFFRQSRARL